MPNPNISAELPPADKTSLETKAAEIWLILNFLVNLTPQKRLSLRKMATKRTGYVQAVFNAVMANPSAIPTTFNYDEYKKDKQLIDDLNYILGLYLSIVEGIQDTILSLGNELMTQSDTCYNYLQRAAKDNAPLTETVNQIATAFNRKPAKAATLFTIPAGGTITVNNVMPATRIVNSGTTVIKVIYSSTTEVTIDPGNSDMIPAGVKTITIENRSQTVEASCKVMIK